MQVGAGSSRQAGGGLDGWRGLPSPCAQQQAATASKSAEHTRTATLACPQARDLLCATWAARRRPGKAEAGFFRAAGYLNAGCPEQALKDARYALVYGPQLEGSGVTALVASSGTTDTPAGSSGQGGQAGGDSSGSAAPQIEAIVNPLSAWPAGLALLSAAHEALADNVPAALAMQASQEGPQWVVWVK